MERLLNNCTDDFWQCGWIYARVQTEMVFIYNGTWQLRIEIVIKIILSKVIVSNYPFKSTNTNSLLKAQIVKYNLPKLQYKFDLLKSHNFR